MHTSVYVCVCLCVHVLVCVHLCVFIVCVSSQLQARGTTLDVTLRNAIHFQDRISF